MADGAPAAAAAAPIAIPIGMENVTVENAMEWISEHRVPTDQQFQYLRNVFVDIMPALDTLGLTQRMIVAILRQGVQSMNDFQLLGKTRDDV